MSIVECSLECNDGEKLIRTGEVHNSNSGSHYYESLSTVLSTMKEDVNSILTVQVEKERRQPSQPQKRPTTDDDDDDDDEGIV